jgi:hypothetical protein
LADIWQPKITTGVVRSIEKSQCGSVARILGHNHQGDICRLSHNPGSLIARLRIRNASGIGMAY